MMDYDSSDDEMATRFEGAAGGVIRRVAEENGRDSTNNSNNGLLPNTTGDGILPNNDNNSIVVASQAPAAAAASRSTGKRRLHQQDSNGDDNNYERIINASVEASASAASAAASSSSKPSMESSITTSTDRDRHEDDETNEANQESNKKKQTTSSSSSLSLLFAPCRKCGRYDFCTATGARRHEAACDGTKNSKGPWKCPTCGRDSFLTSQAFGGHYRCCNKVQLRQTGAAGGDAAVITPTLLLLGRPPTNHDNDNDDCSSNTATSSPLEVARSKLSNFNAFVLECIELFAASQSDVDVQVTGNGKRHITLGNIGIRCVHCARHFTLPIGSISYTADLKTLPHAMYVMVQRHLLVTCAHISNDMKRQLRDTKRNSTSQSCTKGNIGLPAYLRLLAKIHGLTDDDKKLGVRYIASTLATVREEEISAAPTVATAEVVAPSDGASDAPIQNGNQGPCRHSNLLEDEPVSTAMVEEMEHRHHQLPPSGETRPNHQHHHQDVYNPHFSRFLEEVGEEVEI